MLVQNPHFTRNSVLFAHNAFTLLLPATPADEKPYGITR